MDPNHVFWTIIAVAAVLLLFKIRELAEATHAIAGVTSRWAAGGGSIIVLFMALDLGHEALMIGALAPTARTFTECQTLDNRALNDATAFGLGDDSQFAADQDAYNKYTEHLSRNAKILDSVIEK